jgi:hypothetical protein
MCEKLEDTKKVIRNSQSKTTQSPKEKVHKNKQGSIKLKIEQHKAH